MVQVSRYPGVQKSRSPSCDGKQRKIGIQSSLTHSNWRVCEHKHNNLSWPVLGLLVSADVHLDRVLAGRVLYKRVGTKAGSK